MRYNMLWDLFRVVNSEKEGKCLREHILAPFEGAGSVKPGYKCGCCNVCSPTLDFQESVTPREILNDNQSKAALDELLNNNELNIEKLKQLIEIFQDYWLSTHDYARAVLTGNPNNLPALYIVRAFSPHAELGANTKNLLRTANEWGVPLSQLRELYKTSGSQFKPDLLLILNEEDTTSDTLEGWEFLMEEAENWQHSNNSQLAALHICLDFFILVDVDEMLPPDTENFRERAEIIKEILNA